jgi:hypothetical protein
MAWSVVVGFGGRNGPPDSSCLRLQRVTSTELSGSSAEENMAVFPVIQAAMVEWIPRLFLQILGPLNHWN